MPNFADKSGGVKQETINNLTWLCGCYRSALIYQPTLRESNARHEKDSAHLRFAPLLFLRSQPNIIIEFSKRRSV